LNDIIDPRRRRLLAGAGAAVVGAVALDRGAASAAGPAAPAGQGWDHEADIVCVGSGAAACTAAIVATAAGASALLVEKMPMLGGTTGKSGGVVWIPNNFLLRAKGVVDGKEDCIRYMARYAYPERYDAASPTLGLAEADYRLIEAFYDNAAPALDRLRELDVLQFQEFRLYFVDTPAPDYADHLPENKVPQGRALMPEGVPGDSGGLMVQRMEAWLEARQVPMLTDTRVTRLIREGVRVVGVEAEHEGRMLRLRGRRGVVFGTGGFAHNTELVGLHQPALYGSCAMPGSTGDFIPIAGEAGAQMGSLNTAWRAQVLLEEALVNRAVGTVVFGLPGDSMLVVNKYGQRVMNEKRNYNDRTQVHFIYDPVRGEYPNHLLFMLFDQRALDAHAGAFPYPASPGEAAYIVRGETLDELAAKVDKRLKELGARTGGVSLAPGFVAGARASIGRFNEFAKKGVDRDFGRGEQAYDREWGKLFGPKRPDSPYPPSKLPNATMHPLAAKGPYYCIVLAPGALDTNGGPRIDPHARVLDTRGRPIPGLYGAGNCVASPSRGGYYGAGGTIGAAITFAWLAVNHALQGGRS
jgi:succinate dehydrogenase/fumarate reductase flavoprotein subunit